MNITLSPESADTLSRVEGMKTGHVGPTMVRGSQKMPDDLRQNTGQNQEDDASNKKKTTKKKKKNAEPEPKPETKILKKKKKKDSHCIDLEYGPEAFARKNEGRHASIRSMLQEVLRLDEQAFRTSPLFEKDGKCRLKFDGSERVTLTMVLDNASATFHEM